jgi:hypothetical protein
VVHQLITIPELTDPRDTIWSAFDRKLEDAILAVELAVSIRLRKEMGSGVELIRWLEAWNQRFIQHNKTLISIAENPEQQRCLDLSHPNMKLVYIKSINDIPRTLLKLTDQPVPPHVSRQGKRSGKNIKPLTHQQSKPSALSETPVEPLHAESSSGDEKKKADPSSTSTKSSTWDADWTGYTGPSDLNIEIARYTVVDISGEYCCNNCGATRMFCKGDIVDICENRECSAPSSGFSLLFDLF